MATPTTLPATFVAGNVLTAAQMNDLRGAFRILQVVSTTKTDTFTTTNASFTDITGLSVSITPSSTSSKVLVMYSVSGQGATGVGAGYLNLVRGSTNILVGDAASNRAQITSYLLEISGSTPVSNMVYLDSPNTTSATTYKLQTRTNATTNGAATVYINRTATDTDSIQFARSTSTITVMEISA